MSNASFKIFFISQNEYQIVKEPKQYFFKIYALDIDKLEKVTEHNFYEEVEKHEIDEVS